jgi:hypothetical protein
MGGILREVLEKLGLCNTLLKAPWSGPPEALYTVVKDKADM